MMNGVLKILRFLNAAMKRGERCALVTLTDVTGSSTRSPGTHLAVSEAGEWCGSFSGGCVESAVVAEAMRVIREGKTQLIRFGAGSRFIDIRLPCGGGINLLFTPAPPADIVANAIETMEQRRPVTLSLEMDGKLGLVAAPTRKDGWSNGIFQVTHHPHLRLFLLGHGEEVLSLARIGSAFGADIALWTPDHAFVDKIGNGDVAVKKLWTSKALPIMPSDPWTAIIFLFHDHDWESDLLVQALTSSAFYIGAMGSRTTQARRFTELKRKGLSCREISRLFAPIGLIPASRDPDSLAVSILSEVVAELRRTSAALPSLVQRSYAT